MPSDTAFDQYRERIWQIVHNIPAGKVLSYGEVAKRAGLPNGARMVGRALSNLPGDSALPWHRVINSRGSISFAKGSASYCEQLERLRAEGIEFRNERIDWRRFGWQLFD